MPASNNSDLIVSEASFCVLFFVLFQTTGGSDEGHDWEPTKVGARVKRFKNKKDSQRLAKPARAGFFFVCDVFVHAARRFSLRQMLWLRLFLTVKSIITESLFVRKESRKNGPTHGLVDI